MQWITNGLRTDESTADSRLNRPERNRYFHGKLMTARDMEVEQRYHRDQFRTHAGTVAGQGIVCGLDVDIEETRDGLSITIQEGYAIDQFGRQIVVDGDHQEFLSNEERGDADRLSLYIRYAECDRETVPVPGAEKGCEEECAYNRVLELYSVGWEEGDPVEFDPDTGVSALDQREQLAKPVSRVAFPSRTALGDEDDGEELSPAERELSAIAESYVRDGAGNVRDCEATAGTGVFLGVFVPGDGTEWVRSEDAPAPTRVYTNDMLYAGLSRHTADFRNPHQVSLEATEEADGDAAGLSIEDDERENSSVTLESTDETVSISWDEDQRRIDFEEGSELTDQLEDLDDRIEKLRTDHETLDTDYRELEDDYRDLEIEHDELAAGFEQVAQYVLDKTLKYKRRTFARVADVIDAESALEVVEETEAAIQERVYADPQAFFDFVDAIVDVEQDVAEEMSEQVPEEVRERYEERVGELKAAIENVEEPEGVALSEAVEIAVAQDEACELAEFAIDPVEDRRRSLEVKSRSFAEASARFEADEPAEAAELAATGIHKGEYVEPDAYHEYVESELFDVERAIGEAVAETATQTSHGWYRTAIENLERALETGSVDEIVDAQLRVSDAARRLVEGRVDDGSGDDGDGDDGGGDDGDGDDDHGDDDGDDDDHGDDDGDDDGDDGSLDPKDIVSSLQEKSDAFQDVYEQFPTDAAEYVGSRTDQEKDSITTTSEYVGFVKSIEDAESDLLGEIHGQATDASYEAYQSAVDQLSAVLSGPEDPDPEAVLEAQNDVSQAALELERKEIDPTLPFDPTEYTVDQLDQNIQNVTNERLLQQLRQAEIDGEDRQTALDVIDARLEQID